MSRTTDTAAEKIRVYILAKELRVETLVVLELSRELGFPGVNNQLSGLAPAQAEVIRKRLSQSPKPLTPTVINSAVSGPTITPATAPNAFPDTPVRQTEAVPATLIEPPSTLFPGAGKKSAVSQSGLEQLLDVGEQAGFTKLAVLPQLAEIDPEAAILKLRKLTERLCLIVLGQTTTEWQLSKLIDLVKKQNVLSKKVGTYLDNLRVLGNMAAHVPHDLFEEEFHMADVQLAATSLALVIAEALKKKVLNPSLN